MVRLRFSLDPFLISQNRGLCRTSPERRRWEWEPWASQACIYFLYVAP